MSQAAQMRGLTTFITDIRACKSKDQEQARVEQELHKIREKFTKDGGLNGYQRKKYIWKLLYIHILGYEIEFGQQEASYLINSSKFTEKYTGYIATGILVSEHDHEIYKSVANSIRYALSSNNEINMSLALSLIGSLAPKELVEQLDKKIQAIAFQTDGKYPYFIRKKAILCFLRIVRKYPERYNPGNWVKNIFSLFESSKNNLNMGYVSASCSFLLGVCNYTDPKQFQEIVPRIVKYLQKFQQQGHFTKDQYYYGVLNPWVQVKLLKVLQLFPMSPDTQVQKLLTEILQRIIKKTDISDKVNRNNVIHGILFEAANLLIHFDKQNAISSQLKADVIKLLGVFISVREPNLKYLGLETMCKIKVDNDQVIEKYLSTILASLKVNDISIKKRALDLLYLMCTQNTSQKIVNELLSYSEEWADASIKEELVLKIAILAERYAQDLNWYVDVVIRLAGSSGDFVTDDIWHRIIQMITGFGKEKDSNKSLQGYAADKLYYAINLPHIHPTLLKIGAFVVAEFAEYLVDQGKEIEKIYDILYKHFQNSDVKVRCMILNSFAKLAAKYPELQDQAMIVFEMCSEHFDPDLQQRGIEYTSLVQQSEELQRKIFARQPTYSEEIQNQNPLLKKIYQLKLGGQQDNKDPTVAQQAQKLAKQEVEQFINKDSSQVNPEEAQANKNFPSIPLKKYNEKLQEAVLFQFMQDKFLLKGVNLVTPYQNQFKCSDSNFDQVKTLISSENGVLYQDNNIQINYKSQFMEHMAQLMIQFQAKQGQLSNVNLMLSNKDNDGYDFNIQEPNYSGQHPTMVVQVMSVKQLQAYPYAQLFYDNQQMNQTKQKVEFSFPLLSNKFVQPVNMPPEQFDNFWNKYSDAKNDAYYKLESIIKNPAPDHIPMTQVLKKAGTMFSQCFNLKVMPQPSMDDIQSLNCVGQFHVKDTEKNNLDKFPIMVQMTYDSNYREEIKVSYRGGSEHALKTLDYLTTLLFAQRV